MAVNQIITGIDYYLHFMRRLITIYHSKGSNNPLLLNYVLSTFCADCQSLFKDKDTIITISH